MSLHIDVLNISCRYLCIDILSYNQFQHQKFHYFYYFQNPEDCFVIVTTVIKLTSTTCTKQYFRCFVCTECTRIRNLQMVHAIGNTYDIRPNRKAILKSGTVISDRSSNFKSRRPIAHTIPILKYFDYILSVSYRC